MKIIELVSFSLWMVLKELVVRHCQNSEHLQNDSSVMPSKIGMEMKSDTQQRSGVAQWSNWNTADAVKTRGKC